MLLFDRIKRQNLNVYDLVRLNASNAEALLLHASILNNNLSGINSLDNDTRRRGYQELSDTLAETNYVLNNSLNTDLLNESENNPLFDARDGVSL